VSFLVSLVVCWVVAIADLLRMSSSLNPV
jgi:hypothetical protein